MKLDVVLGLQWGDEGKGKIVDVLAGRYPTVARFQVVLTQDTHYILTERASCSGLFHQASSERMRRTL